MFTLEKRFTFEASHVLPHHNGKCARLHGHSWVAYVRLAGETLRRSGPEREMLLDFGVLKAYVQPIVDDHLDHHHLNESLGMESPTSELVARWLFEAILSRLPRREAQMLVSVRIEETCTSACTYQP